jgi:hypothetical protein
MILQRTTMSPKEEDFIRFYRDAVIAGHDDSAAETMRHFKQAIRGRGGGQDWDGDSGVGSA